MNISIKILYIAIVGLKRDYTGLETYYKNNISSFGKEPFDKAVEIYKKYGTTRT